MNALIAVRIDQGFPAGAANARGGNVHCFCECGARYCKRAGVILTRNPRGK